MAAPFDLGAFIAPYLSLQTLATVIIIGAVFAARDRAAKFIQTMQDDNVALKKEQALLKLRQTKIMLIQVSCPSVAKENVSWLRDDSKNSKPPVKSLCERRIHGERDSAGNK